jgi:hypothetical protein
VPLPRRVPNLGSFARGGRFRAVDDAVARWLENHFARIEATASWLHATGEEAVADFCVTSLASRQLILGRDPPSTRCTRQVVRVYGADGSLAARLDDLVGALAAAGWGRPDGAVTVPLQDLTGVVPPVRTVAWRPTAGAGAPAGLDSLYPAQRLPTWQRAGMNIWWGSRGWPYWDARTPLGAVTRARAMRASALFQPVEMTPPEHADPIARALDGHEHAIVLGIDCTYYLNPNVNARPGRIRKRLIPVRWAAFTESEAMGARQCRFEQRDPLRRGRVISGMIRGERGRWGIRSTLRWQWRSPSW